MNWLSAIDVATIRGFYKTGREGTADWDRERERSRDHAAFPRPYLHRHTSFSLLFLARGHTYGLTQSRVTCSSCWCTVGSITGLLRVKSGSLEGLVPFFCCFFFGRGQLLFFVTQVWRGLHCPLSHFSMDNGLPPSPLLSLSLPLPPSASVRPWPLVDSVLPEAHCQGLTTLC